MEKKGIKIMEVAVNGPGTLVLPKRVVSVSITNMVNSPNNLIIGWDEDPSQKNFFTPGDSRPYGPFRTDDYIDHRSIRHNFQNLGGGVNPGPNQGLIVICYETGEPYC